jgi:hypothetical protein
VAVEDGDWRPLWRLDITPGLGCGLTIASLALFVASTVAVIALGGWLHPGNGYGSTPVAPVIVELTVALLATYALHEGVHALAFKLVGGRRVRFGAGLPSGFPVLYVGWPGQRISRDRFVLVALAPLVVLDLVGLALMLSGVTVVVGAAMVVLNTAGAAGDLWMTAIMLSSPFWLHVEDIGLSLLAWAPPAHAADAAAMPAPGGARYCGSTRPGGDRGRPPLCGRRGPRLAAGGRLVGGPHRHPVAKHERACIGTGAVAPSSSARRCASTRHRLALPPRGDRGGRSSGGLGGRAARLHGGSREPSRHPASRPRGRAQGRWLRRGTSPR